MKVVKFGGTSLANAEQIKKVCRIITDDPARTLAVVSAPGKRHKNDIKVTDLLIALANAGLSGKDPEEELQAVVARFDEIISDLKVSADLTTKIRNDLVSRVKNDKTNPMKYTDCLKAAGEDLCAQVVAAHLSDCGYDASYVNPRDAGMLLSKEYGNAAVLPEAYEKLSQLKNRKGISIFPGFFGYSADGEIVTFSRGGSDITGSILAAAVDAELYENFTDVDNIYSVNPNIVANPVPITTLTYREMRELSYAGFSVFHEEALVPVYRKGIPVAVKNTNNPCCSGTTIVAERETGIRPVTGIASAGGFCTIFIRKYLMNREVGFGRKLLQILEQEGIPYEHTPSGIDDISVVLNQSRFSREIEQKIIRRIREELNVDDVFIVRDQVLIMVVGEGARHSIGLAARATKAFAQAGINIEMINQGSSEVSMMFCVNQKDEHKAVEYLYNEFFKS